MTADKQLLAAAGNSSVKIYEVNSSNAQPIHSFDGHTGNVTGSAPAHLVNLGTQPLTRPV